LRILYFEGKEGGEGRRRRKEEKEGGEGRRRIMEEKEGGGSWRRRKEEDHGGFYTTFKSVIFARLSRIFQAHLLDTQTYLFLE
jgi:hypothetical protein